MKNQSTATTDNADASSAGPNPPATAVPTTAGQNRMKITRPMYGCTASDSASAMRTASTASPQRAPPPSCRSGTITTAWDAVELERRVWFVASLVREGSGAVSRVGGGASFRASDRSVGSNGPRRAVYAVESAGWQAGLATRRGGLRLRRTRSTAGCAVTRRVATAGFMRARSAGDGRHGPHTSAFRHLNDAKARLSAAVSWMVHPRTAAPGGAPSNVHRTRQGVVLDASAPLSGKPGPPRPPPP